MYASFEEFKNNKPTIFNYHIEAENNSLMSLRLINEQGLSYYSRTMWGYCDGQQTYVMMDGNLFPIINYQRAYYVYGSKEYLVKKRRSSFTVIPDSVYLLGNNSFIRKRYPEPSFIQA